MRHTCEHCATTYEIPDERVAGRFLKVRCQMCRGTMHVVGLRPLDARGDAGARWWCALGNMPRGPYRDDEVLDLVAQGDVHARTRMWCSGMAGWERVCESEGLAWVYTRVIEVAARAPGHDGTSSAFDRAALLSDGNGYFPDPTLKSGIIVIDSETQRQLELLARKNGVLAEPRAHRAGPGEAAPPAGVDMGVGVDTGVAMSPPSHVEPATLWPALAAAAVGFAAGVAGLAWFMVTPLL